MAHRPSSLKNKTFIVEVVDRDARQWTANATETAGILKELRSAPPATAITIYEWELVNPINPEPGWFHKFPFWRHVRTYPWVFRTDDGDQAPN